MMNNPLFSFYAPPGAHYSRNTLTRIGINKHEPLSPGLWALLMDSNGQMHPVTSDYFLGEFMTKVGSVPIYMASPSTATANNADSKINNIRLPSGRLLWPGTCEANILTATAGGTAPPLSLSMPNTPELSHLQQENPLAPLLGKWRPWVTAAEVSATAFASGDDDGAVACLLPQPRVTPNNWATSNLALTHPLMMAAAAARFRTQQPVSQMTPAGFNTASPLGTLTTTTTSRKVDAKAAAVAATVTPPPATEMNAVSVGCSVATHTTNQTAAAATTTTTITPCHVRSKSTMRTTAATPPKPTTTTSPAQEALTRQTRNTIAGGGGGVKSSQPHAHRSKYPGNHNNDSKEITLQNEQQGRERGGDDMIHCPALQLRTRKRKHNFNEDEHHSSNVEHDDDSCTSLGDNKNDTAATKLQQPLSQQRNLNVHADKWGDSLNALLAYKQEHGHCHVPFAYQNNPALARWVKRQRYHYKLYQEGKPSPMTPERLQALLDIGFVWDSQETSWNEKYVELVTFRNEHGHCNVPTLYGPNPSLAIWVKYQRKQYRYWQQGAPSALTPQRIYDLEKIGFAWLLRSYHRISDKPKKRRIQKLSTSPVAPCTTKASTSSTQ